MGTRETKGQLTRVFGRKSTDWEAITVDYAIRDLFQHQSREFMIEHRCWTPRRIFKELGGWEWLKAHVEDPQVLKMIDGVLQGDRLKILMARLDKARVTE